MADLTEFRVLSFDCYGTIIDWETGILRQLQPWLAAHEASVSDAAVLESFGVAEAAQEALTPTEPYPVILERVHHRLAEAWGLQSDDEAAARFGSSVERWPPFADSHDALLRLQHRYRLVILSNVDRASFAASARLVGIDFDAVYTAEDVGSYKPDPANFDYLIAAERAAGFGTAHLLHVGQSLFHDHVPAAAAGLATCWIRRPSPAGDYGAARPPESRPRVDFEFTSLRELADATGV